MKDVERGMAAVVFLNPSFFIPDSVFA